MQGSAVGRALRTWVPSGRVCKETSTSPVTGSRNSTTSFEAPAALATAARRSRFVSRGARFIGHPAFPQLGGPWPRASHARGPPAEVLAVVLVSGERLREEVETRGCGVGWWVPVSAVARRGCGRGRAACSARASGARRSNDAATRQRHARDPRVPDALKCTCRLLRGRGAHFYPTAIGMFFIIPGDILAGPRLPFGRLLVRDLTEHARARAPVAIGGLAVGRNMSYEIHVGWISCGKTSPRFAPGALSFRWRED